MSKGANELVISKAPLRALLFVGETDLENYYTTGKYGAEDSQAQLYIHFGTEEEVPGFFVKCDYYVTNRTPQTVGHSCLADLYGATTLSGVDIPIFPAL